MTTVKNTLACLMLVASSSVFAFMPAAGMWGVDSEDNGLPGRGFQIEAENEIMVFTYFGYRPDGSGTFHYASGPIINNTFTSALLNTQGGTSMGGVHQDAVVAGSAGNVTINFTSGKHGFITFPGEPQRAISKRPFGYAEGPDGLLGTWLFTMVVGQTPFSEVRNLSIKTGTATSTGNGIVTNSTANFTCEYQISGTFAGAVACFNFPQVTGSRGYLLKISGDEGDGVALSLVSTNSFSASNGYANRIETKSGIKTGLNDGTIASLTQHSQLAPDQVSSHATEQLSNEKSMSSGDLTNAEALKTLALQTQVVMQTIQ
ncbi:hypothetical protein [Candidatus Nitrotoga arctica]|uniref:Uncharacterized protein n=1 Tax=Candidatus Nitrotoga arctica TaxID=453162 RepID=A0ABN8AIH8_9PROT|nr:hypothetical protein [Candidatus Nitrotoga arctica]CAG9932533.1 conserved exported protein of unknown function [Candidatus Nitrotoga arctica]